MGNQLRQAERIVFRILEAIIGAVVTLLALRMILRLLAANPYTNFVAWLYSTTDQMLAPFAGIFPTVAISGVYVIELSTLFAMLAYAFIGWVLIRLVSLIVETLLRAS